jgi:hypothetical protein
VTTLDGQTRITICPSKLLYHIPCPGCGITRATILVFKGRLLDALRLNPNVILSIAYVIGYPLLVLYGVFKQRPVLFIMYQSIDRLFKSKLVLFPFLFVELIIWALNIYRGV